MAEETTQTAAPTEEQPSGLKDFGNLDEAFDQAFPATADKAVEEEATPPTEPVKAPEPTKVAPPPEKPSLEPSKASEEPLPDFLTGKVEEKKPETTTVPEVDVDAIGLREIRRHYKELFKTAEAARARETALQQELETAKKSVGQTPAEVEAQLKDLQQKNQELSDALEQGYTENHPVIRKKYNDSRNAEIQKAHRVLDAVKADTKAWDRAMNLPLEARIEALEEIHMMLPQAAKDILGRAEGRIDELDLEREQVFADRKGLAERLRQQDLIQQREAYQQHEKETLADLDYAQKDLVERLGIETLRKSDNPAHAKWNESVERRIADAKKLMLEIDDRRVMSRAAYLAASALDYREMWRSERDRRIAAENQTKSYEKAEPSLQDKGEEAPKGDDKMTFADAVAADFPRK